MECLERLNIGTFCDASSSSRKRILGAGLDTSARCRLGRERSQEEKRGKREKGNGTGSSGEDTVGNRRRADKDDNLAGGMAEFI